MKLRLSFPTFAFLPSGGQGQLGERQRASRPGFMPATVHLFQILVPHGLSPRFGRKRCTVGEMKGLIQRLSNRWRRETILRSLTLNPFPGVSGPQATDELYFIVRLTPGLADARIVFVSEDICLRLSLFYLSSRRRPRGTNAIPASVSEERKLRPEKDNG